MARATAARDWPDDNAPSQDRDWLALRSDLVKLLDQVESRTTRPEPSRRLRESEDQRQGQRQPQAGHAPRRGAEPSEHDRHLAALRSVQRAVARFSDRADDEEPEDHQEPARRPQQRTAAAMALSEQKTLLQSAVEQIRARTQPPAPPSHSAADTRILAELTRSVASIGTRLEHLETGLREARRSHGDITAIGEQVSQLTGVVEMLAGAVGETGQVKRLEGQIADLARVLSEGPRHDVGLLTSRLDELAATVDRLADLQVQHMGRDKRQAEQIGEEHIAGLHAIEDSVRSVYDRIDALERGYAVAPQDIERLTQDMADFTEAMRAGVELNGDLLARVDSINARIGHIEESVGTQAAGDLRADVEALRGAVAEAIEPRFTAIETQLAALGRKVSASGQSDAAAEVEYQIRQLIERMDRTGEQLNGLARLYHDNSQRETAPDYEALATLVARRTSEEISRAASEGEISEHDLSAIEGRLSRMFSTGEESRAEAFTDVRAGIQRVDERLDRLEQTLGDLAGTPHQASSTQSDRRPAAGVAAHPPFAFEDQNKEPAPVPPAPRPSIRLPGDAMPASPAAEVKPAPERSSRDDWERADIIAATAGGPQSPAPASSKAGAPALRVPPGAPVFDPDKIERPAKPRSAFADPADPVLPTLPEPGAPDARADAGSVEPQADRTTFIAAARRAVRNAPGVEADPESRSLIGRAFSRFQNRGAAAPAPAEPREAGRPRRTPVLPGSAEAEPLGQQPDAEAEESFLSRHRRVILLAAALVAVSLLTLNLVTQRLGAPAGTGTAPAASQPADPVPALPSQPQFNPGAMLDPAPTGSVNPFIQMDLTRPSSSAQALPGPIRVVPTNGTERIDTTTTAAIPPAAPLPPSPIKLQLPPDNIGPVELREAAANGDSRAQFEIAAIFTNGEASPANYEAAAVWYERAAAQGFAPAAYRLGNLYEHGHGVAKDLQQARLWYERAAEAGNRMSMHNLAALFASGELGSQQFDAASRWFEAAAERGMVDSQFNLGMLHARGLGVAQDLSASYKWFSIAAAQGDADAAQARDDVARSLDAETVMALQAEIAAWKVTPIEIAANFAPLGTWSASFDPGQPINAQEIVQKVQVALGRLGYDVGKADGVMGPKTAEAIRLFERAVGMGESGAVNPRLLAVLGSQPV